MGAERAGLAFTLTQSLLKLNPRRMMHNPVMFVVWVGAVLTTVIFVQGFFGVAEAPAEFVGQIALWLWLTLIFANFSEALAESRGKAQANALRRLRRETQAKVVAESSFKSEYHTIPSPELKKGELFLVETGDIIPADGDAVLGVASIDESAVTGESAPVIREAGGDRSAVTAGTRVLSDRLIVRVTAGAGEGFLDRLISLVEAAKRRKTPGEIALDILLAALTLIFLVAVVTLLPYSLYAAEAAGHGEPVTVTALVALLVTLIPTTIGGLLPAIGIAGMDRMLKRNVIATSGKAIEAAGDVDVLLLDKTGTITLGNRQAVEFVTLPGIKPEALAEAAQLASLADQTPEGRSVVVLAKNRFNLREQPLGAEVVFIPFSAETRISGVDLPGGRQIRKGAPDAIYALIQQSGNQVPNELEIAIDVIAKSGGTPLGVVENGRPLGVIHLKDVIKGGIKERFAQLRQMGIKTVMITGDNPVTAAAIAQEAGVDDFLAQATPEAKLNLIRAYQNEGHLVAMTGDGTNDAPALAQADVAVAMNTGTQAAREAANLIDLDSNPTKLIEVVEVGKQLLMTRGALTTFSLANDIAKYFAILPAVFASIYPGLDSLNVMRLSTPESAVIAAVIFNALILVVLIPLALRGVAYRPLGAGAIFVRNLTLYGLGGLIAPFIGIKLIDLALVALGWA